MVRTIKKTNRGKCGEENRTEENWLQLAATGLGKHF